MTHNVSEEALLIAGVVVLAMCIIIDIRMACKRRAQWLPGCAVVIYALCLQFIGYVDVQNVRIGSRHRDQQLEELVCNQLSIDTSRLVLLVFVGYLLPDFASTRGIWPVIAALFISLSTHIAIEFSVALQSRVSEKDKVVQGQSGIWVIVSGFVMLESILYLSYLVSESIIRGRFIREHLGSRIPLALDSPENNNETISWDTCQSELLKSWIVAHVSQPEYVLIRSDFRNQLIYVVTFNVVFMAIKVICLRPQLHGPSSLFTIQCIFIILGWFAVSYRFYITYVIHSQVQHGRSPALNRATTSRYLSTIYALSSKIENSACQLVVQIGLVSCMNLLLLCVVVPGSALTIVAMLLSTPIEFLVILLVKRFCSVPPEDEDEDFPRYKEALEQVCMGRDNAESLWVRNKDPFHHIKTCLQLAYKKGGNCKKLQKVIGSRLVQNAPPSEDVKELLEPLESVKVYFPWLKDSFRRITALVLLMEDDSVSEDQHSNGELKKDVRRAFKKTEDLIDFLDCPDNIVISMDIFNISNLEAFMLKNASTKQFKRVRFNFRESSTVATAIEKLFNETKNKLEMYNLLGDVNSQAVDTKWDDTAEAYAMYKLCKLILDRPEPDSAEQLQSHLFGILADLITMCVTESPKILVKRSRKWAAEFREDKISAAIQLAGFACGVIDKAKQQHLQPPV